MPSNAPDLLTTRELRAISTHAVTRVYPKHTVVVSEGDATNPAFAFHLLQKLIARVRALTGNVKSLALMDVYGRVAHALLERAREENGQLVTSEKPTQLPLAGRIGASREMVSRILKELAAGGRIRTGTKRRVIAKALPQNW